MLINPYLLYGNIVWASNYNSRTRCLVILQKRIIRIIARLKYFDHSHESFLDLGIMKFEYINAYMTGLFTYKSLYNLLPPATIKLFTSIDEVHEHFTRGLKGLATQYARTNYRRFSLPCWGPIVWNSIPTRISSLPCFTQFKKAWRRYLTFIKPTDGK